MKRILFRADAKPSIGIGDLISLISLSKHFVKAGWETYFMIRGYEAGLKISQSHSVPNLTILNPAMSLEHEVKAINLLCEEEKIDIAFFEITERKLSDYKGLSLGYKKAAISFDGELLDNLSLVVSWIPDVQELFHQERYPNTKFLLGYEYVTLPPEFNENHRIHNRQYRPRPERLLIAMGGADENNLTKRVVDTLIRSDARIDVRVILGGGYEHLNDLEKTVSASRLSFEIKYNISDMLNEYLNSDIAIGAGGLTASELVASKTPTLLIAAYEHQIGRCKFFHSKRWAHYLGYRDFDPEIMMEKIISPPPVAIDSPFRCTAIIDEIQSLF